MQAESETGLQSAKALQAGPYQLLELLAEGTDTQTWRARPADSEQQVIVKILQLGLISDWQQLELFEREVRTLAHLAHPRIPALLDAFELQNSQGLNYCLVTPRIQGQTLADKLKHNWLPTEAESIELAGQLLEILIYLHSFYPPVVHRDLKPSNLILDQQGQLHLIDFGSVLELLSEGTGGVTMVGTLGYIAPEQFSGKAQPASDLYSLGATLVHLLTGRNPSELSWRAGRLQYRGFTQCSLPFAEWLDFLLFQDLSERFASAEAALTQLDQLSGRTEARALLKPVQLPQPKQSWQLKRSATQSPLEQIGLQAEQLLDGRYLIKELLGEGSRARVYRAQDLHQKQPVVIKELTLKQISHWKELELFEREVATLKKLSHERIPRFLDFFERQDSNQLKLYLVSSEIAGQTLQQKLDQGWRPAQLEIWQLALQLLELLVYLQEQHPPILHRDIKPSNLLLNQDQELCLIDFGAVQNRFRAQGSGGSTVIGTIGYMAPEQFAGKAGLASDLYAAGATLLRLLSGRSAADLQQTEQGLQFEHLIQCPSGMQQWLQKMLAPNLSERYQNASEALKALRHYLAKPATKTPAKILRGQHLRQIPPGLSALETCQLLFKQTSLMPDPERAALRLPVSPELSTLGKLKRFQLLLGTSALAAGSLLLFWFCLPDFSLLSFFVVSGLLSANFGGLRLFHRLSSARRQQGKIPASLAKSELELEFSEQTLIISERLGSERLVSEQLADNTRFRPLYWIHWSNICKLELQSLEYPLKNQDAELCQLNIQLRQGADLQLSFPLPRELAPALEACLNSRIRQAPSTSELQEYRPALPLHVWFPHLPALSCSLLLFCSQGLLSQGSALSPALQRAHQARMEAFQAEFNLPQVQPPAVPQPSVPVRIQHQAPTADLSQPVYTPRETHPYQPVQPRPIQQTQMPRPELVWQNETQTRPAQVLPPQPQVQQPRLEAQPGFQAPTYHADTYRPPAYQNLNQPPGFNAGFHSINQTVPGPGSWPRN